MFASLEEDALKALKKKGISSGSELLFYMPFKYADYRNPVTNYHQLPEGTKGCFSMVVESSASVNYRARPNQTKISLSCGKTHLSTTVFGAPGDWVKLPLKARIVVTGKVSIWNDYYQLASPVLIDPSEHGKIIPKYRGKPGVIESMGIHRLIMNCLKNDSAKAVATIERQIGMREGAILKKANLPYTSLAQIFVDIHMPVDDDALSRSMKAVDSLASLHALQLALENQRPLTSIKSFIPVIQDELITMMKKVPFTPTDDQKRAIWDITKDLKSEKPMDRLLSGDVGCGKTLAYAVPLALTIKSGCTAAVLMPNTLLATQVAREIFELTGVPTILCTSKTKVKEIEDNHIIVGTSSIFKIIEKNKIKIDLLVIDEQQKMGTKQRDRIIHHHTNLLEVTATAIPRTMAMLQFGGKSVSRISQQPVKKTINTLISDLSTKRDTLDKLKNIISDGHQVVVLYPLRNRGKSSYKVLINLSEETDSEQLKGLADEAGVIDFKIRSLDQLSINYAADKKSHHRFLRFLEKANINVAMVTLGKDSLAATHDLRNVSDAEASWEKMYPGKVCVLHGKLDEEEKQATLDKINNNECSVIISTSIIEIGLTIPSLRGAYIVDADNYGVGTLHQFRGRVARKGGNGVFIMGVECGINDLDEKTLNRLNILVTHNNGFEISKADMMLKGFGGLGRDSVVQSGVEKSLFIGYKLMPSTVETFLKNI